MNTKSVLTVIAVVFIFGGAETQFVLAQSGTRSPGIFSGSGSRGVTPAYPGRTYQPQISPAAPNHCGQVYYPRYGVQPAATYLPGYGSAYPGHYSQNQRMYGSRPHFQPAGSTYRPPGTNSGVQYLTNRTNLNSTPSGHQLLPLQQLPLPVPHQ
ncbi:hypothetical protein Pan110_46420 [Gimesia panareensis]|nr:hypothetical protein Pan110_46420 [Gimesia panareensis]